jgi:hypothetical protein
MSDDRARIHAERAYYRHLYDQAVRALHQRGAVPAVPQPSELDFVDGHLIWRGRPVWPSGDDGVWVESTRLVSALYANVRIASRAHPGS